MNGLCNQVEGKDRKPYKNHIQAKIELLSENKQIGTKKSYKCTLVHIQKLMGKTVLLSDITIKWLQAYEKKKR